MKNRIVTVFTSKSLYRFWKGTTEELTYKVTAGVLKIRNTRASGQVTVAEYALSSIHGFEVTDTPFQSDTNFTSSTFRSI